MCVRFGYITMLVDVFTTTNNETYLQKMKHLNKTTCINTMKRLCNPAFVNYNFRKWYMVDDKWNFCNNAAIKCDRGAGDIFDSRNSDDNRGNDHSWFTRCAPMRTACYIRLLIKIFFHILYYCIGVSLHSQYIVNVKLLHLLNTVLLSNVCTHQIRIQFKCKRALFKYIRLCLFEKLKNITTSNKDF